MNLRQLTDDDLLSHTSSLAAQERRITLDVLLHLKEIERRRLHLDRGYSSLYEYALKELRYSEGAAYRRVQAMRLLRDMPEVEEKISSGQLNLTTASKIQTAARDKSKARKLELVQQLEGKSTREVEQSLAAGSPTRESARWVSTGQVELKVQLGKKSFSHLDELKAIKSNSHNSYSHIMEDLIELGQDRWNPLRRAASSARRSHALSLNPRHMAPSLRMEIWKRDGNQCAYVDPQTKRRCQSKSYLHIDHILPVALGGKAEPSNLRLLCAQHNQHRAERTFGPKPEK